MAARTTAAVAWQLEHTVATALWTRDTEPVEWIAAAIDTVVTGIHDLLDIADWRDVHGEPWPEEREAQHRFVEARPVTVEDQVLTSRGYAVHLFGPQLPSPDLDVNAGGVGAGARIPMHSASLGFDPRYTPTPPRETVDDLVALAVRAWQPLLVAWTTADVVQASGRHGWDVPAGYRVWISPDVGTVTETADGVTARPLEGGTLITAPDEWDAATVAHAVNATLDANGLHDIRQTPEHPAP